MKNRISEIKGTLQESKAEEKIFKKQLKEKQDKIKALQKKQESIEEAQMILRTVAQKTQSELEFQLSEIVTLALGAVFDDPYEFKVEFVIKRGKSEAELFLMKDGEKFDPIGDTGGGVVDVASFALRIALWNLSSPKSINTIVLDEPFRFLSKGLQQRASMMLKMLSNTLGLQFIIVTHEEALLDSADKIFHVKQKNTGISVVTEEE